MGYTGCVPIKAVAFDIDGTMYSSTLFNLRMIPFGLRNARLMATFARVRRELHARSRDSGRREAAARSGRAFRQSQAELFGSHLGIAREEAERRLDAVVYGELESSFSKVRLFKGLVPALESLKSAGLRLAALSDFPAARKLELLGLSRYFELALSSEDSGLLKPAPEPFQDLARALGLDASEILYVGNSLACDLAGALAAGMPVAIVGHRPAPGADLRFTDWKRLVDFVLARRS